MARPSYPWFRFYVEAMQDRKLRSQPPATRWLWVALLAIARASLEPGVLLIDGFPATNEDIADVAALSLEEVCDGLAYFIERSMVVTDVAGRTAIRTFQERQYNSDSSTLRTAKHRSKNKANVVRPSVICSLLSGSQEEISVDEAFERFWNVVPEKRDKINARRAFDAAIAGGAEFDAILTGAMRYREEQARPGAPKVKYPQGWLNSERWKDGPAQSRNGHDPDKDPTWRRTLDQLREGNE